MRAPTAAPSAERLDAAVRLVVDRLRPDQIILFGSAARGEMTPASDLDLLVITDDDGRTDRTRHERWQCAEAGGQIDVVVTNRATAERERLSAARVHGAALEEGRTVYLREAATPTPTGPTYTWNGNAMVKTTKYEPDHAAELLDTAQRRWRTANREDHPKDRCKNLHESMEHAFKAIIVADGRRVEHHHELDKLWDQAETAGGPIAATREPEQLERLSMYAGEWRYEKLPADEDPEQTWKNNRATGEDVLQRRAPVRTATDRTDAPSHRPPRPHGGHRRQDAIRWPGRRTGTGRERSRAAEGPHRRPRPHAVDQTETDATTASATDSGCSSRAA